jgi:hypothetical protein
VVLDAWDAFVDDAMQITNGSDDGEEATEPRRCHGATAWGDSSGGSLRAGSRSVRLRAGQAWPKPRIVEHA